MSGGISNRPEFQKMLGRVRQRHFDLILVWALDRFSREGMINTLSYIRQLREYKTGLKSLQETWLDTSQEGVADLLLAFMAWVAEQEKKRIFSLMQGLQNDYLNKGSVETRLYENMIKWGWVQNRGRLVITWEGIQNLRMV
jgi:DNA invertase Pin-like site-specific DNA recombinase